MIGYFIFMITKVHMTTMKKKNINDPSWRVIVVLAFPRVDRLCRDTCSYGMLIHNSDGIADTDDTTSSAK